MQIAPDARENSKLALAMSVLRRGGTIFLKARGTSMLPAVWPGDVLTVQGAACAEIVPGDIVLALGMDRIFVHRLVGRNEDSPGPWWVTKGDAMPHADPPEASSDLLGRVVSIRRGSRDLLPRRQVSRVHSLLGSLACRSDRFRNILLRVHALRVRTASLDESFTAALRTMDTVSNHFEGWPSSR
jgi:signal peptidase